jgi:phosphoglycerol transferase MdoB-like AlkP superfamily enzyme
MQESYKKSLIVYSLIFFSILYLEVLFKVRVLAFDWNTDLIRVSLFSASYSILLLFMLKFFQQKTVKIALSIGSILITFLYFNQEIYSSFVEGFYSFSVVGDVGHAFAFLEDYFKAIRIGDFLYLVPFSSMIYLTRKKPKLFDISYSKTIHPLYFLLMFFVSFTIARMTISSDVIQSDSNEIPNIKTASLMSYSDQDLYTYVFNAHEALKKFGVLTYTQRDFANLFYEDPLSQDAYEVLIKNYLSQQPSHLLNAYSNTFEDMNLILIQAESLDTYAINEELTPTLYDLKQNYAYFENFYAPLYYRSTADTEFMVQTSMFPNKNVSLSMESYLDNTFTNTLPNLFREKGYDTLSFHDYMDYFYPRGDFHRNTLDYDEYYGSVELGMTEKFDPDKLIVNHHWLSDYEMMRLTIPMFIEKDHFFVNYITVSGHFPYEQTHEMAKEEYVEATRDYLDNLAEPFDYSDELLYYMAVNMEFDKALAYLLQQLQEAGKDDNTVIIIYGDHYAYGVDKEDIWKIDSTNKIPGDELAIHNVPLLLVSPRGLQNDTYSQYISTIDLMPTIANLFGLNMDYKAAFGRDAFQDGTTVVRFADGSFLSKHFRYDSLQEQITLYDNQFTEEYVRMLQQEYLNEYLYNVLILDYDYFGNENK